MDLNAYLTSRQDALVLLRTALRDPDYSQLFHATETYRAGADGQQKTVALLQALGSLVEDLLLMVAGTPALIRNLDLAAELAQLAQGLTIEWIDDAARALVQVEQGMRHRNLLRSLSLDAMAVSSWNERNLRRAKTRATSPRPRASLGITEFLTQCSEQWDSTGIACQCILVVRHP